MSEPTMGGTVSLAVGSCGRDPASCQGGTSTEGWVAIAFFGVFVISVIVALVIYARRRG